MKSESQVKTLKKTRYGGGSPHKVFGRPAQTLYGGLMKIPKGPVQAQLIRELQSSLKEKGVQYHSRTVKRQLLGNIEYIPEALEEALLGWTRQQPGAVYKKLLRDFTKNKNLLESSSEPSLYISASLFSRMVAAYLYLKKQLSRRRLAVRLQKNLEEKKILMGLETLQAALSGKTQKIRKCLEEEMRQLFFKEGFKSEAELLSFLQEADAKGRQEIERVPTGNIHQWVDAYLLKSKDISKRQLALKIKGHLASKGYCYHLSSIQSVIEGKTKKTKRALLEAVYDTFKEGGLFDTKSIAKFSDSLSEEQRHRHDYVDAKKIPDWVRQLLEKNPGLTRRSLALILRDDLEKNNFQFSLSTLQYVLAGKTQRTRGIVVELLGRYLTGSEFHDLVASHKKLPLRRERVPIDVRVIRAFEQMSRAAPEEREALQRAFLDSRAELIKSRWNLKFRRHPLRKQVQKKSYDDLYRDIASQESYPAFDRQGEDLSVTHDGETNIDRLVS